jgi:hypothetical protein
MYVKKISLIDVVILVNVLLFFKNRLIYDFGYFEEGFLSVEETFGPVKFESL